MAEWKGMRLIVAYCFDRHPGDVVAAELCMVMQLIMVDEGGTPPAFMQQRTLQEYMAGGVGGG